MISSTFRFVALALSIPALAILESGCAQAYKVEATARPDALDHISYSVREGTPRTQASLNVPGAADCVRTALSAKGMYEAPKEQRPDLDVMYVCDITKKTKTVTMFSPNGPTLAGSSVLVPTPTGRGGSDRLETLGSDDSPPTITEVTYEKTLHILAIEKNVATGDRARVWDISIITEDTNPSLEKSLPLLAAAGCDRIGTNTDGPITVRLREKDEVVSFIKRGM